MQFNISHVFYPLYIPGYFLRHKIQISFPRISVIVINGLPEDWTVFHTHANILLRSIMSWDKNDIFFTRRRTSLIPEMRDPPWPVPLCYDDSDDTREKVGRQEG